LSSPTRSPASPRPRTPISIPEQDRRAALGRFYGLVAAVIGGLLGATVLVLLLGDQTQLVPGAIQPANGADDVSTRARITIVFDRPLDPSSVEGKLHFDPPQAGTLQVIADRTLVFTPAGPWQPDTQYDATLDPEVRGRAHGRLPRAVRWTFRTRALRLAFLRPEAQPLHTGAAVQNLWVADADGTGATRVTSETAGVLDFDVSGDGAWLVYSAPTGPDAANLFAIHPDGSGRHALTTDSDAVNSGVACSPTGDVIAYERRVLLAPAGPEGPTLGVPKLWLVQADGTSLGPLRRGSAAPASYGARWSANGEWLAYYEASAAGDQNFIHVGHLGAPGEFVLPNYSGQTGTLSPDGHLLAYSEQHAVGPAGPPPLTTATPPAADTTTAPSRGEVRVVVVQPAVGTPVGASAVPTVLSQDPAADDGEPVWAPQGAQIAFLRRRDDSPDAGTGLWLVTPDGAASQALTRPQNADDQDPVWSPDGTRLLFRRVLRNAAAASQVWVVPIRPTPAPAEPLLDNATAARWLP